MTSWSLRSAGDSLLAFASFCSWAVLAGLALKYDYLELFFVLLFFALTQLELKQK